MSGMSGISGGMMGGGTMGAAGTSAGGGVSGAAGQAGGQDMAANTNTNTNATEPTKTLNTPSNQMDQAFKQADEVLSSMQDSVQQNQMLRFAMAMMMLEALKGAEDDDDKKSSIGGDALMAMLAKDAQAIEQGMQAQQATTGGGMPGANQVANTYGPGAAGAGGGMAGGGMSMMG